MNFGGRDGGDKSRSNSGLINDLGAARRHIIREDPVVFRSERRTLKVVVRVYRPFSAGWEVNLISFSSPSWQPACTEL